MISYSEFVSRDTLHDGGLEMVEDRSPTEIRLQVELPEPADDQDNPVPIRRGAIVGRDVVTFTSSEHALGTESWWRAHANHVISIVDDEFSVLPTSRRLRLWVQIDRFAPRAHHVSILEIEARTIGWESHPSDESR